MNYEIGNLNYGSMKNRLWNKYELCYRNYDIWNINYVLWNMSYGLWDE